MLMVNSRTGPGDLTDMEILSDVSAGNIDAYGKIVSRYRGRRILFERLMWMLSTK